MLKAILFDFDGVLVESVDIKTKAFASLFEDEGIEIVKKIVKYHIENGGVSRFKKFEYIYENFLKREINAEIRDKLGHEFSELVMQNVIDAPWVPGAKDFLKNFYQKIDLYVVSGTPEKELIEIINQKIGAYFKGVYGSPETKGNLIKQILANGPYTKEEIIFVGDAITDLNGAFEAGIPLLEDFFDENCNPFEEHEIPMVTDLHQLAELLK